MKNVLVTLMSVCNISILGLLLFLSAFLGDLRREFMQCLSIVLHGTLGSHLRDALQEGNGTDVACFPIPWA
jgi:hypothetical protein